MSRSKKQPYSGNKKIDSSCRNHGSCSYCESNRLHQVNKEKLRVKDNLKELDSEL